MGRAALESKEGSVDCYRLILPQVIIPSREEPDQNECTEQSQYLQNTGEQNTDTKSDEKQR